VRKFEAVEDNMQERKGKIREELNHSTKCKRFAEFHKAKDTTAALVTHDHSTGNASAASVQYIHKCHFREGHSKEV